MAAELVIFDCDGVLVDSEVLASAVESELLAEVGAALSPAQISERFVGLSEEEMARRIYQEFGVVLDDAFRQRIKQKLYQLLATVLRPIPGMAELLSHLDGPICVASSSSPERVRLSLASTGLAQFFGENLFSSSMVARGKPAPDLFLYSAEQMGVAPARCVVVEDSPFGVAAGVEAGMTVIGFSAGGHCPSGYAERLIGAGADLVVGSASELDQVLKTLLQG